MGCGASAPAAPPQKDAPPAKISYAPAAPTHVTLIMYDFKDKGEGDAWYAHFLSEAEDGWLTTAAAPGMQVCKLFPAVGSETRYGWYEEWDVAGSQVAYTKHRFATGFLAEWLGLDVTLPQPFGKLRDEDGVAVEHGILVMTTAVKAPPAAKKTHCSYRKLFFGEKGDCDAFLAEFGEGDEGFRATAEAPGCLLLKLFKAYSSNEYASWAPSTAWTASYVGLYEEWESKEAYEAHAAARDKVLAPWIAKCDAAKTEEYVMGLSSVMGKSDLAE